MHQFELVVMADKSDICICGKPRTEHPTGKIIPREKLPNMFTARLTNGTDRVVYDDVHSERVAAHIKHGKNGNSRENAHRSDKEWLPILVEEIGEVAHELTYDVDFEYGRLRKELIQVAAMAIAWIEAIDDAT